MAQIFPHLTTIDSGRRWCRETEPNPTSRGRYEFSNRLQAAGEFLPRPYIKGRLLRLQRVSIAFKRRGKSYKIAAWFTKLWKHMPVSIAFMRRGNSYHAEQVPEQELLFWVSIAFKRRGVSNPLKAEPAEQPSTSSSLNRLQAAGCFQPITGTLGVSGASVTSQSPSSGGVFPTKCSQNL